MNKRNSVIEYISYELKEGALSANLIISDETIWASQKAISEIFECGVSNVLHHIGEVFESGEIKEDNRKIVSVAKKEGTRSVNRHVRFYSLKVILAVGYRVNSAKAVQFRSWANDVLEEYTIKGYALDSERLSRGAYLTKDYYDELLEEIRLIRLSERRLYQKVTDIFSTALDYDKNSETTFAFFKTVQNKLHYSITGNTAAEIIRYRADASKENMGLKTWNRAPQGRIHSTDVVIAKNYLDKDEMNALARLVSMYLDFAEDMANRHIPLTMKDYSRRLDALLELSGRDVLDNPGKVSHEVAEKFALSEFEKFKLIQEKTLVNDFDLYLESPEYKSLPVINGYKERLLSLLGKEVEGKIDRPVGAVHPDHNEIVYPLNYGHLDNFFAPDGEEQDVYFLGISKPMSTFKGRVIAIIERIDDNEDKLVVTPFGLDFSDEEIEEQVKFQEQYFTHRIIRK